MKLGTKKNIYTIFALAIPIIVENVLQSLLGTTDTYFAGKLADNAIAGISVTNLIMNIFISFFSTISIGTTAVVSRNYGKKNFKNVNISIANSIILGLILGVIISLISFLFRVPILKISRIEKEVINYAMPYYLIVVVPSVFLCLQLILSSCLRSIKDTKTPMYVTAFSNILNIILNIVFITMGLGVFGLVLATTLSRLVGMSILFFKLKNHDENIHFNFKEVNRKDFFIILNIGIPAGIEKLIMRIGQLIYNSMIISIGTASYVAHNIAGVIEGYSYIPSMGFGVAIATLMGIALGENNPLKAKKQTILTYYASTISMVVIGIIFFVFAPQLASIFTKTKEIQEIVIKVLRIIAFFQPFSSMVQIMTYALQGAGDTKFPMYSTFIGIWGIRIGIGYVLGVYCKLGLSGVWYAYAIDVMVRGILLFIRFKIGKWKRISIN